MGLFFASKAEKERDTRLEETQRSQAAAADPSASAWVSANAGTGKTHVLTMRVLRLLLGGTPPERILALTYTKAAAAEMSKRVFARLAEWVTADEASLKRKLAELLDRAPTAAEMQWARQLFAIAIETPGGLKVQTIHAFCERLLQRFPLEAGVPPGFAILDEHERNALLKEATDEMLAEATGAKTGALWPALQTAIAYAVNDGFDSVLQQALAELGRAQRPHDEASLAAIEGRLRSHLRRTCRHHQGGDRRRALRDSSPKSCCRCWRPPCAPAARATRSRRNACNRPSPPARPAAASRRSRASSSPRAANRASDWSRRRSATPRRDLVELAQKRAGEIRRPAQRAQGADGRRGDDGAAAARQRRARPLHGRQGAHAPRSTSTTWSARPPACSPPPRPSSGCSTSSTAVSTTSWSTRRRTRAPCSGM